MQVGFVSFKKFVWKIRNVYLCGVSFTQNHHAIEYGNSQVWSLEETYSWKPSCFPRLS